MLRLEKMKDPKALYAYQSALQVPYFFKTDYDNWNNSLLNDTDGQGNRLFSDSTILIAYEEDKIVGFVQFGNTAMGFDETGELSEKISYPVIRQLYFDRDCTAAGQALLDEAKRCLSPSYAFFHYFGMSCYARHGKLFEGYEYIGELLKENGFAVEHENVYYSSVISEAEKSEIELEPDPETLGAQQTFHFRRETEIIGECEVHYVSEKIVYLRWIYVSDSLQNKGIGSKCMAGLRAYLRARGYERLDTDTAMNNLRAQHYYEKNGFVREGITRSYYRDCQKA